MEVQADQVFHVLESTLAPPRIQNIPSPPGSRINCGSMNNLQDRLHPIVHGLRIHESIPALLIIYSRHAVPSQYLAVTHIYLP